MESRNLIKIAFIAMLLAPLFASAAYAQSVTAAANGALSIVSLRISPQPVVAGDNVTVVFQLYNSYNNALTNVNLQLEASNPVINVSLARFSSLSLLIPPDDNILSASMLSDLSPPSSNAFPNSGRRA